MIESFAICFNVESGDKKEMVSFDALKIVADINVPFINLISSENAVVTIIIRTIIKNMTLYTEHQVPVKQLNG